MTDKPQTLQERLRALDTKDAEIQKLQALVKTTRNTALLNLKVAKDRGALLAEAERALEHCLREHGGYTIKGETERVIRAALAKLKAARP